MHGRPGGFFIVDAASLRDRLLSQEANVLEPPFLAQPRSADDLEDFLESRIRIRDLRRYGRVLHGPHPLSMPEVLLRSCSSGGLRLNGEILSRCRIIARLCGERQLHLWSGCAGAIAHERA